MKIPILKFIQSGLLTGMPSLIYNPYTKTPLNIPLTVSEGSIYLNFRLTAQYSDYLQKYINKYDEKLCVVPVCLLSNEESSKYLSVNVYNCSSPAFLNGNKETLRCELNTYVQDKESGKYGTLILDYLSTDLSMDPVNLFKFPPSRRDGVVKYEILYDDQCNPHDPHRDFYQTKKLCIDCSSKKDKIKLSLRLCVNKLNEVKISTSEELVKFSDYIYYKNGIYDKLYYDDTLVNAHLKSPSSRDGISVANCHNSSHAIEDDTSRFFFSYKDLFFEKIDSVFYFENKINFVGSMWENIN